MNLPSTIVLLLLMALCGPAKAQLVWHKGEITLVTSIRLTGELCYQPQANALLFRMADKWRVYQAYELHQFRYTDSTTSLVHTFAPYEILRKNGETQSVIFEELIVGADVQLLELSAQYGVRQTPKPDLPYTHKSSWQTPKPRFVWLNGQLVAPDEFVETELDNLVATAPEVVKQWASHFPRPANPKALARWLTYFNSQVARSQSQSRPMITAQTRPF